MPRGRRARSSTGRRAGGAGARAIRAAAGGVGDAAPGRGQRRAAAAARGRARWQAMADPADMDFVAAKAAAAREIALAFGVPPMLLGLPGDNTYANYQEANRAFWRLTVLPLAERVAARSRTGSAGSGETVELRPDLDQVPALAAERDAQWRRVADADFLTTAEKRALLGLPRLAEDDDRTPTRGMTRNDRRARTGAEVLSGRPGANGRQRHADRGLRIPLTGRTRAGTSCRPGRYRAACKTSPGRSRTVKMLWQHDPREPTASGTRCARTTSASSSAAGCSPRSPGRGRRRS